MSNAAAKKLGLGKFIPPVGRLFCAPVSVALILCAALAEALPAALSQCVPPPSLAAALKAQPDASAYARLGNWFANRNQPACAADAFDKAVAMQPDSADYAYHLGISLFSAGEPRQAITPLEQSLRIDSTSVDAHLVLGSVLSRVGRKADADAQWRIVLSLDAKSSAALEYLGRDLLVDGNYVAVIDLLRARRSLRSAIRRIRGQSVSCLHQGRIAEQCLRRAANGAAHEPVFGSGNRGAVCSAGYARPLSGCQSDSRSRCQAVSRRRGIANPLSASAGADSRPGSRATLQAAPQSRSKPLGGALSDGPLAAKCPRLHGGSDLVREFRNAQS